MSIAALREKLASIGQSQVLAFYDSLPPERKQKLETQLAGQDVGLLKSLADQYVVRKPEIHLPREIQPVQAYPRVPAAGQEKLYADATARGIELLKGGKVGGFLVAGGQGTRLGYDGPKGEYKVTPIKQKPLFQVFAEQLHNHSRTYGKVIPWYVMTSDANDAATRSFFKTNNYFGYSATDIFFFQQGMMPAYSLDGKLLLGDQDSLALSPDGHGGSLRALDRSGALADMKKRGIEHLSYFQVDNPMVHTIDPLFLGLHDLTGSEMSSKTVSKAGPLEKVGNFCIGDGKVQVIEYSDLPESLARQTNADGSLAFNAGSIAIHALRVSFIERLNVGGRLELPWHRAEKKVPYVDAAGNAVKPEKVNAVKLEQFVFDAIPLANNPLVFTTSRAEEFSPVKNAQGDDSPATCRRDQVRRNAEWLEIAGVDVPRENSEPAAVIEISPLYAVTAAQLKQKSPKLIIKAGANIYIEQ